MVRRATDTIGRYGLMPTKQGWFAYWDDDGRRKRARIGQPRSASVGEARAAFALWVRSREAALAQDTKLTIGEIMDRYIDDRAREGKRADKMRFQWTALRSSFEHLQPSDLESEIVVNGEKRTRCHKYAVERYGKGIARDTIHSELALVRTAMAWAARRRLISPVHVWVSSPGKPRRTALSADQIIKLLGAIVEAPPHIRLLMLIALATGARKQAILDLTWDRVDLERGVIDFNTRAERSILDTSHQKGRAIVDVGDELVGRLRESKDYATCEFAIEYRGKKVGNAKKGVAAVFRAAGLSGKFLGLHALRHTLASSAAAAGIDMRQVQRMLGHDDIATTERVYVEFQRGALSAVARHGDGQLRQLNDVKNGNKSQP